MRVRRWQVGLVGACFALGACGQSGVGGPASGPTTRGGVLELAVSQTCTPGSDPACQDVGGEHVAVVPSDVTRVGVASATRAADDDSAIDVTFDGDGAEAFAAASTRTAQLGETGRLVLGVGGQVLSAVRVPSGLQATRVRVIVPAHLSADDVVRQIAGG